MEMGLGHREMFRPALLSLCNARHLTLLDARIMRSDEPRSFIEVIAHTLDMFPGFWCECLVQNSLEITRFEEIPVDWLFQLGMGEVDTNFVAVN